MPTHSSGACSKEGVLWGRCKIGDDIAPAGVNHMILALSDAHLVEFFSGETVENVPEVKRQLRLVAERMLTALV